MLPLALLAHLATGTTVSLNLPADLACPAAPALAERLGRVGLTVMAVGADLQVTLAAAPEGFRLTALRTSDGKTFARVLQGDGDCDTLERLVTVLVHSWAQLRLPHLNPKRLHLADAGALP